MFRLIRARILGFLEGKNNFLLLKLPTGAGKTTNAMKVLADSGYNWIYLAPFHHNIDENLAQSPFGKYKYVHLKSRAKLCIINDFRELAKKNINIRPICEHRCPYKSTDCPYYQAKREVFNHPQNWAGVHHHINNFLKDYLFTRGDDNSLNFRHFRCIIVDENPIGVLFINKKCNGEQLARVTNIIRRLDIVHKDTPKVLRLLNYMLICFLANNPPNYDKLYKYIDNMNLQTFYEAYQESVISNVVDGIIDENEIPLDIIEWLMKIKRYGDRNRIEQMIVFKGASGYTKPHYYFMCYERDALHNLPLKVIALDGTANIDIWESMLDTPASVFQRKVEYENMYQLSSGEYPLSSWVEPYTYNMRGTGKRLCKLIDNIASKKRFKVLVVCLKALQGRIAKCTTAENLIYGNYYYLRSRNDFYKHADTVILACQPNIPEFQLTCFSAISDWGTNIWRKVFTDEEMLQAVGRIRQNIDVVYENRRTREIREIYIFSSARHENFPEPAIVDIFGEWSEKLKYSEMNTFVNSGLLPKDIKENTKKSIIKLVTDEGLYKTELAKLVRKELSITFKEAVDLIVELMNEKELIRNTSRSKIYKRLVIKITRK